MVSEQVKALKELPLEDVPEQLRPEFYFDFDAHPFAHADLFRWEGVNSVVAALGAIELYARAWLHKTLGHRAAEAGESAVRPSLSVGKYRVLTEEGAVCEPAHVTGADDPNRTLYLAKGARLLGATIYLGDGDIFIGEDTVVEPGVGIKGPTIIGRNCELRQGTYLRGSVIVGDGVVLRGEIKNCVLMDEANFPHPSYLGDSIVGYRTHFGNQATSANLGIFAGIVERSARPNLTVEVEGTRYDLGRSKMGVILGDYSQVGCNSVADPGTFLAPYTIVYSLTRITKGFYGPREVLKNKPLEKGIVERAPLRI